MILASICLCAALEQPGPGGKGGVGGVEHLTQCDTSEQALVRGLALAREARGSKGEGKSVEDMEGTGVAAGEVEVDTCHLLADEEFLPFPPGSFDLVLRFVPTRGFLRDACYSFTFFECLCRAHRSRMQDVITRTLRILS